MVDRNTYDRYSIPQEQQMMKIGHVSQEFQSALVEAQTKGINREFTSHAWRLFQELAGKPGDGALEIYRDLQRDIDSTKSFIDKWGPENNPEYNDVLTQASDLYEELLHLQELIDQTPPEVTQEIKANVRMVRTLSGRSPCFIATAVYGVNAPEVQVLREFRNNVLMESGLGRRIADLYYSGLGERVANFVKEHTPSVIPVIKKGLDYLDLCFVRSRASTQPTIGEKNVKRYYFNEVQH